jgi:hypothetical protein
MLDNEILILALCIFSVLEILVFIRYIRGRKNALLIENFILYIAVVLLLYYNENFRFPIQTPILVLLICTMLGHLFIGEYFDVYHKTKYYDRFLHVFGSFTFALFAYSVTRNILGPIQSPDSYIPLLVASIGISIGAIFEIGEFLHDSLSKKDKRSKHQHGLTDTDFDLISDVIGSVAAGVLSFAFFH